MTSTFNNWPGRLNIQGVTGKDLKVDIEFEDTNLTGFTFTSFIILENAPLEKRQAITITNTDLANGLIRASLTDTETTAIGPVSGKPWFLQWSNAGDDRNVLAGMFQLNRF